MTTSTLHLVVLRAPEWQKPLFAALEHRRVSFSAFDVTRAAFSNSNRPARRSTSIKRVPAYLWGHTRAVLALPICGRWNCWARVLNGADVFALELSKSERRRCCARWTSIARFDHLQRRRRAPRTPTADVVAVLKLTRAEAAPASTSSVAGSARTDLPRRSAARQICSCCRNTGHDRIRASSSQFLGGELLYRHADQTHGRFNVSVTGLQSR